MSLADALFDRQEMSELRVGGAALNQGRVDGCAFKDF
jgi:hypothetical protein